MENYIEWTSELSVGVQEIDEQHQILIGLLNQLHQAIAMQTDDNEIQLVITELFQYTIIHFTVEESLMRIFNYPDYEVHKESHRRLSNQVIELRGKLIENSVSISVETLNFLKYWLTHHIMVEDKKYSSYLVPQNLGLVTVP